MFEILVALIFTVLILVVNVSWVDVILLIIMFVLVLPGVYAMITGAPFVPTDKKAMAAMLKLGKFRKTDRVVDIGCGDGRLVRTIARYGVKSAIGYEFSIPTYLFARFRTFLGKGREVIKFKNFWRLNFENVDVIVCFLLVNSMKKFEKKIWPNLRKGTRVLSHLFQIKGVKPVAYKDSVYLYIK